jgi:hypothetical protein
MAMMIYDFNRLSHHDKVMFAWNKCLFLIHHSEDPQHTASFYYRPTGRFREEYFIELWYNAPDNLVDSILSFPTTNRLEHYLAAIKIDGI